MARNNRNTKKFNAFILKLFLVSILIDACNFPKVKFGPEFNSQREKIGLTPIPNNWKGVSISDNFTTWKNPNSKYYLNKRLSVFYSKTISYIGSKLTSEEDLYYSGKNFSAIDGEDFEWISIKYFYSVQKVGDDSIIGWHCTYNGFLNFRSTNPASVFIQIISHGTADSLLKIWEPNPLIKTDK